MFRLSMFFNKHAGVLKDTSLCLLKNCVEGYWAIHFIVMPHAWLLLPTLSVFCEMPRLLPLAFVPVALQKKPLLPRATLAPLLNERLPPNGNVNFASAFRGLVSTFAEFNGLVVVKSPMSDLLA